MPRLGAHMSIADGVDLALLRGREVGCDAIQIFTKSSNQWKAKDLTDEEVERFAANQAETAIEPVVGHCAYLLNLGTPDDALWKRSVDALVVELERSARMRLPYLVLHPGAHVDSGEEAGMRRVIAGVDATLARTPRVKTMLLLEITAGQGSSLCYSFDHLAQIIHGSEFPQRLGICFDTCHAFAAGYELRTREGYEATFAELDRVVGLERLRAFHVNDAKKGLGSRVDRHEHIGQGQLGLEPFRMLLNDPRFAGHPMLLETPKSKDMHEDIMNLTTLRGLLKAPRRRAARPSAARKKD